jgi:thiamine biosynthesis lipoprotein
MGLPVRVTVFSTDAAGADACGRKVFATLARLEDIFSDWRPTSEAMRLCSSPGKWHDVSESLWEMLELSARVVAATGGLFDPTVGPLVRLWRESRRSGSLPTPSRLAEARSSCGWHRVERDSGGRRVRVQPGTLLDFGGIAKGYALSQALRAASPLAVSLMIEAGGDIACGAAPPGKNGWRIALPDGRRMEVAERCVSTSGDDYQRVEIGGKRYAHIVDPRTGLGAVDIRRVSLVGGDGALTDALATAACLMSPAETRSVLDRFPDIKLA